MQSTLSAPRRRLAAGVAGAMIAGLTTVTLVQTPGAQAAPATGELTWNVSEQFVNHLSTRTLSDGAIFDETAKTFTFPATEMSVQADGTAVRSYDGTVKGAFVMGATEFYSVTITDPTVTVAPDGDGEITATVSAANAASGQGPAASTEPTLVTVAEFSGATAAGGTLTATPNWAGVLPAGSQTAIDLGITNPDRPVDGKSFHPEFLGAITSGVRAHFHYTSSGDQKRPGDIAATATMTPSVTPTVTAADPTNGVTVKVEGTGFSAVTNPGDQGVYVALAPADTVIDFEDRDSTSTLAAVDWVMPSRFVGDTFITSLSAPIDKLVKDTEYAVFTWQAHTHSNTTQDTTTPVAIDWTVLEPAPTPVSYTHLTLPTKRIV